MRYDGALTATEQGDRMTDIELATATTQSTAPAGPVVWILSVGEAYEGTRIVGVYLDRDLAHADFVTEAQKIHDTSGIRDLQPADDGSLTLTGGCDVLTLMPHPVKTKRELQS
jgi:hypothetical protein